MKMPVRGGVTMRNNKDDATEAAREEREGEGEGEEGEGSGV